PILIAHLFEAVRLINASKDGKAKLTSKDIETLKVARSALVFDAMGLRRQTAVAQSAHDNRDGVIQMLIKIREQARADKNWALSDQVRDELSELGIQLKDGKDGTEYSLN